LNLRLVQPRIVYHYDVDLFGLPKVERSSERPPQGMILLGLTQISDHFAALPSAGGLPGLRGGFCVWLTRVDALLGNPVMDVYVAQEYAPGSCEYNVILNHENTHVRFNLETLRDWLPALRAALTEAARRKFPAIFPKMPAGGDINAYLFENVRSILVLMREDMAKRNATIDTPENYRRENAKCHNWSRHGWNLDH
jgi:hypothetical protein